MPSEIVIAAAGGGKTTRIVRRVIANPTNRAALVTYTNNNVREIRTKLYERYGSIPPHVEVWSWYRFLLHELARPYQNSLLSGRIDGLHYVEGQSALYVKQSDTKRYYFSGGRLVYSDKISQLIIELNKASGGAVLTRLAERFRSILIDEVQDMAGYDLDLLELILRAPIDVALVGDHRQATLRTNNARKNKGFAGIRIIDKLKAWEKARLAKLSFERETYRSHQLIANLADLFFPGEPSTISKNETVTGHDGVFIVRPEDVSEYVQRFRPQVLRLDRTTPCGDLPALNFGDSKGMTFNRVLIFPHKKGRDWIRTGDFEHVVGSAAKLYVGITRARHSVAFVFDGESSLPGVTCFP